MHATGSLAAAHAARTKIVATVGPACRQPEQLIELMRAGVSVFRLNMAHGSREDKAEVVESIRQGSQRLQRPVGILVDLAGPKIRLGELPGGELECTEGAEFRFVRGTEIQKPGELTVNYERLIDELSVGDRVMLADGTVGMAVEEKTSVYARCRVTQSGTIRSRQGVNLPGARLTLAAITPADEDDARWAAEVGADFVSLSFIRQAAEVRQLKSILKHHQSRARVIAKIEKPEALANLDEIVQASDGIMVARGDLGVEIDVARVPAAQKRIIAICNRYEKPVITATQMLESMQWSRQPTRAEATDVANAILDGTDACMLSAETAVGRHPRAAVEMMTRIALETEPLLKNQPPLPEVAAEGLEEVTEALVLAAGVVAQQLAARMIVVASHSGATALAMSKRRNSVPTIGVSDSDATLRQMSLFWGVIPLAAAPKGRSADLIEYVVRLGREDGSLSFGDRLVLVAGTSTHTAGHNMVLVHEVN